MDGSYYMRYKIIFIFLLATAIGMSSNTARAQVNRDETAIRSILSAQVSDWNKGDVTTFMQGYWHDDSVMFITKSGPVYGYQPVLDHYKKSYPDKVAMGVLSFSGLILKKISPDYYFVVGAFHLHRDKGDVNGQFTLLFRKIKGEWKIIVDHSST